MNSNSISYIKNQINDKSPTIGIVLGSGLQGITDTIKNKVVIPYNNIPSFHATSVEGHPGEFIIGNVGASNNQVIVANGRFHLYEGLSYDKTYLIIDIFKEIGCQVVIITNSSGCLDESWSPGDLMIINSHIDFTFRNSTDVDKKKRGQSYYNMYLTDLAEKEMIKNNISYHR